MVAPRGPGKGRIDVTIDGVRVGSVDLAASRIQQRRIVFASGARFVGVDGRVTPAAIRFDSVDGWIGAIARSNRRWNEQIYDVQVRVDGNIAQVWAPYTFYLDGKISHCGINAIDLLRDGAGWKVTQVADTRRRESCPDPLTR